jgi:hypothetical protein
MFVQKEGNLLYVLAVVVVALVRVDLISPLTFMCFGA